MITIPDITYSGNKDVASSLKGAALKAWGCVTHPNATGQVKTNRVYRPLPNGGIATINYYTDAWGRKQGTVKIYVPEAGGGDDKEGFIYTRDMSSDLDGSLIKNRYLWAQKPGFNKEDTGIAGENWGVIDWTDHKKNLVSWNGVNRYAPIDRDIPNPLHLYLKTAKFDLATLGITGVVAGAGVIKGHTIVFVETATGILKAYFMRGKTPLGAPVTIIMGYIDLLQCVAVSADGSKASTLLTYDIDGETFSIIIDLAITLDIDTLAYAMTGSTTIQSINPTPVGNNPLLNHQATTRTVVAIDYDKTNTREVFFIEYSFSNTGSGGDYNATGTINYNDQYTVNLSDTAYRDTGFAHAHNYDYIVLDALDMRHGIFAYTRFIEHVSIGGDFTISKEYWLEIQKTSLLRVKYKNDYSATGTLPALAAKTIGVDYPFYRYMFMVNKFQSTAASDCFVIPLIYNFFQLAIEQNNGVTYGGSGAVFGTIVDSNYDNTEMLTYPKTTRVLKRVALPLLDKYGNMLISFSPIRGVLSNVFTSPSSVQPETGNINFVRDTPVIIKINNKNQTYYDNVFYVTPLVNDAILDNEMYKASFHDIIELKGVI